MHAPLCTVIIVLAQIMAAAEVFIATPFKQFFELFRKVIVCKFVKRRYNVIYGYIEIAKPEFCLY